MTTLSEMQKQVDDWIKSVGVRYFNELTNVAILNMAKKTRRDAERHKNNEKL